MHPIQKKLYQAIDTHQLGELTLREIGNLISESGSPQKIKHHLEQLGKKGLIQIDTENQKITKVTTNRTRDKNLLAIPIMGSANCGRALLHANEEIVGNLRISKKLLPTAAVKSTMNLFALRAVGNSMNKTDVAGKNIEDGDYVIVDAKAIPKAGDCVVSIIEGMANIKRFYPDPKNNCVVLVSESTQDVPPIYIHESDMNDYLTNGKVIMIMKDFDELTEFLQTGANDAFGSLPPLTKKEYDYYMNLPDKR
jgi:repressor LexA